MRTVRIVVGALLSSCLALGLIPNSLAGTPEEDKKAFQNFYKERFPNTPFDDFANGIYSIDSDRRAEWEQMEEFPQYELDIAAGEALFHRKFANGKTFADCFPDYESGVRQNYPHWDPERGEVVTMEWAINLCLEANGEKALKYNKGPLAEISAYLAYLSRGQLIDVKVPEDDPRALAAYEDGKRFYYTRRGQLNFSCASCHVHTSGLKLRANLLSPALGQVSHFPVYRKKWSAVGTLHRRYGGCNRQVRAASFKPQSRQYRNLEYFHTYMSNGIRLNGPGGRQ